MTHYSGTVSLHACLQDVPLIKLVGTLALKSLLVLLMLVKNEVLEIVLHNNVQTFLVHVCTPSKVRLQVSHEINYFKGLHA